MGLGKPFASIASAYAVPVAPDSEMVESLRIGGVLTVNVNETSSVPAGVVAVIVIGNWPLVDGVPLTVPLAFKAKPVGRDPVVRV